MNYEALIDTYEDFNGKFRDVMVKLIGPVPKHNKGALRRWKKNYLKALSRAARQRQFRKNHGRPMYFAALTKEAQ